MPQQNGKVEQTFATLYSQMRAMFNSAGFTKLKQEEIWMECAVTATKLENLIVNKQTEKCHYKKFYGKLSKYAAHL